MDKASAHGAGDCRLESCRGHVVTERALTALSAREEQEEIEPKMLFACAAHLGPAGGLLVVHWEAASDQMANRGTPFESASLSATNSFQRLRQAKECIAPPFYPKETKRSPCQGTLKL